MNNTALQTQLAEYRAHCWGSTSQQMRGPPHAGNRYRVQYCNVVIVGHCPGRGQRGTRRDLFCYTPWEYLGHLKRARQPPLKSSSLEPTISFLCLWRSGGGGEGGLLRYDDTSIPLSFSACPLVLSGTRLTLHAFPKRYPYHLPESIPHSKGCTRSALEGL